MMRILLTVTVALCLTGCAGLSKPHVEVASVTRGQQTDQGSVVNVTLKMSNPNDVELPVYRVDYQVTAGDRQFAFKARPPVAMPVRGELEVVLPAAFAASDLAGPVQVSGRVYYQPPGEWRKALRDLKIPWPHASFSSSSTLE
ncbi:MAG: LEA type 2 family protein [Phycisphaeraceae bacterium]|nr:LEA type 2 family protein [Phycisphaeraceae bacterium]